MALPKLNDKPKYEIVIPSTGETVRFRPYLVREEKVLMMAIESKDPKTAIDAIVDTIIACVDQPIERTSLKIFDVEYMFTKIRGKSVGETSKIGINCKSCEHTNEMVVNYDDLELEKPEMSNVIKLTDDIQITMKWPSFTEVAGEEFTTNSTVSNAFSMINACIHSIQTEEDNILMSEVPKKEIEEFVESMTSDQLNKVKEYVEQMPKLKHDVSFDCEKCNEHNKMTLEGIQDFF